MSKKRKKYARLPNAFGTIRYLGDGRRNCYAVHPPARLADDMGDYVRDKALCYVSDWYVGFAVLNAWHAGTYKPGDELTFAEYRHALGAEALCQKILSEFTKRTEKGKTFAEVYELFYEWKYGEHAKKKLSKQSQASTRAAFLNCKPLHQKPFRELRHRDLQDCIDACPLRSASIENMVSLIKQMYKYAMLYEICDRDYSQSLAAPPPDDEHGVPFSDEELAALWKDQKDPTTEMILIMCYSGFRIAAYGTLAVHLEGQYFQGGVKTAAGRDRIVPIHSAILPLVERRLARDGKLLGVSTVYFRKEMRSTLSRLGLADHTPHDCRHTFSRLCEKYGVNESDRKRMLGHSFGADITNGIYGHRTVDDLRAEIEKIKICDQFVTSESAFSD